MGLDGGSGGLGLGVLVLYFSLDLGDEIRLSSEEQRMVVVVVIFVAFFGKTVHVELADERVEVAVLEVEGKHDRGETVLV